MRPCPPPSQDNLTLALYKSSPRVLEVPVGGCVCSLAFCSCPPLSQIVPCLERVAYCSYCQNLCRHRNGLVFLASP